MEFYRNTKFWCYKIAYLNIMITERLNKFKLIKKMIYAVVGLCTFPGLAIVNRIKISGTEYLNNLPKKNVLFVSNHQTYFADVIAFIHIFCAVKWRKKNRLGIPYYLINPFSNVSFVAAEETMKENIEKWKGFYENLAASQMEAINKAFSNNNNMFSQWTGNNPFTSMNFNNMPNMDMFNNMNKSFTEMYQNMMSNFKGSGTTKDVFGGLFNHTQSFMKFYEMWSPVQKAMQNNTFNPDMISKLIKPEAYKEFMDS